jgi:hypothetical protein
MNKSPFPGMDPFLERDWLDVHARLVNLICDQVQEQLPDDLCARMESRVLVDDDSKDEAVERHPDVRVIESRDHGGVALLERPQLAEAEPDLWVVETRSEPEEQRWIQIVDAQTHRRVITAIELISPSNKLPGIGRTLYQRKQAEFREGGVNMVEIDLTRRGDRVTILPFLAKIYPLPTYVACVWRASDPEWRTAVYLMPLDKPLKPIRIPLRPKDEDVVLNLQPLVALAYERGRYGNLDYSKPLDPPATRDEAAIIESVLKEARSG